MTPASRLLNAALVLVAGGRGLPEVPQGTSPLARAEPAAGAGPGVGFEPIGGFALGGRSGMFGRSGYLLLTRPKPLSIWTEVFVDGVSERKRDCGLSSPGRTKLMRFGREHRGDQDRKAASARSSKDPRPSRVAMPCPKICGTAFGRPPPGKCC